VPPTHRTSHAVQVPDEPAGGVEEGLLDLLGGETTVCAEDDLALAVLTGQWARDLAWPPIRKWVVCNFHCSIPRVRDRLGTAPAHPVYATPLPSSVQPTPNLVFLKSEPGLDAKGKRDCMPRAVNRDGRHFAPVLRASRTDPLCSPLRIVARELG
jgi:hypothetical protein